MVHYRQGPRPMAGALTGWQSWREQCFDGAAFVHSAVAFGGLVERQRQVEDLARVDVAVLDKADQVGEEAADGGRAAVQVDLGVEQLSPGSWTPWETPT